MNYQPGYPQGAPQQALQATPPAQRPGVDLKVSFAGWNLLVVSLGVMLLGLSGYFAAQWFQEGPPYLESSYTSDCAAMRPDMFMECKDTMAPKGKRYPWTVKSAGRYRLAIRSAAARTLELDRANGVKVRALSAKSGVDATALIDLDPGDYVVRVDDAPGTAATADKTFRIYAGWVAKKGQVPRWHVNDGIIASLPLAVIFLLCPLMFMAMKNSQPLRVDPTGVTMRNGKKYLWSDLQSVKAVSVRVYGQVKPHSTELRFRNGMVDILYRRVDNFSQLRPILDALHENRNPWV